jgi:hypothetical protein
MSDRSQARTCQGISKHLWGRNLHSLSVIEDWATPVEQIIDAEFDPGLDGPSQRSIVVVCHIIYDKRAVGSWLKRRFGVRTDRVHIACLECEPDLLKGHTLGLMQS